jgi:glycosyltransferase involved in cell wall biosynthesis
MAFPRTLIVTPTYNEKDNLERFVDAVRSAMPDADLMIVDDNSPDGTGDMADAIAAKDDHVNGLASSASGPPTFRRSRRGWAKGTSASSRWTPTCRTT